jgi:hypothetical protein
MIQRAQRHAGPIAVIVASFVSVFFVVANVLPLDARDIAAGLIAGPISGLFVPVTKLVSERRAEQSVLP